MNAVHLLACRSRWWQRRLDREVLPRVLAGVDLAGGILELGPGPGLVTGRLLDQVRTAGGRLTALELDARLASSLRERLSPRGVQVVQASATSLPFPDATFDVVVCCTLLHHLPSQDEQDQALREAIRVLRPGGRLVGSDSVASFALRLAHLGDTLVPVEASCLPERLTAAGGVDVDLEERSSFFVFRCRRP